MEVVLFFPRPWPGKTMSGRVPFSLVHLYNYLQGSGFKIRIVDERFVSDMPSLIDGLGKNVLCFGISSFTGVQIKYGLKIASLLKNKYPHIPIIWGGWHPSMLPDQTLQHPLVDIVVRGQGEETFKSLLYALSEGKDLSGVNGISYKLNKENLHNPNRELLPVLENMKINYECVDVEKYVYMPPWGNRNDRALGIITGLGCAFNCGFCSVPSIYMQRCLYKNIDAVLEEVDYFVDRYKINSVTIDDDNFFMKPARVKKFCEGLIDKPYRIAWEATAHVSQLLKNYDDGFLTLVKESGCKELRIGAESGSDEVLSAINKKVTVSQTFECVMKTKAAGIGLHLSTIVCFPNVSPREITNTMEMILTCKEIDRNVDFRIFFYTPYPSTAMYKAAIEKGMKEPKSLEGWAEHTLRKFRAPWVKKKYRKQVKHFCFYYYPYAFGIKSEGYDEKKLHKRILNRLYHIIFQNMILVSLAKWRVRNRFFKFPIDAEFVMMVQRLKSWYGRLVYKNVDPFSEYDED